MVLFGHGRRITTARGEQLAWWPSDSFTWLLEQVLKSPKVASSIKESQSAIAIPTTVTREARRLIIFMMIFQSICPQQLSIGLTILPCLPKVHLFHYSQSLTHLPSTLCAPLAMLPHSAPHINCRLPASQPASGLYGRTSVVVTVSLSWACRSEMAVPVLPESVTLLNSFADHFDSGPLSRLVCVIEYSDITVLLGLYTKICRH